MAKKDNMNEDAKIFGKNKGGSVDKDAAENQAKQSQATESTDQNNADAKQNDAMGTEAEAEAEQPVGEADALAKQVRMLEEENSFLKDQLLRKQAEFENFRKRLLKEKDESAKYANQMLMLDLTPIIDDFERAIKSVEDAKDFTNFHSGVVLIEKQLVSMLERQWGIKRFEPKGEAFDPERHLAIAVEESAEQSFAVVTEVYQKGYMFFDRVLRPAKVKVVKPSETKNGNAAGQSDNNDKK